MEAASEDAIVDIVRDCAQRKRSLEIIAGSSKRAMGRAQAADAVLDVGAVSGILSYEPDELVLTARAATPLHVVEQAMAERRQIFGFAPADWGPLFGGPKGRSTVGGIVASNASGARRVKAGAARDHVIGCRFVNGRGEAITAGGKVVKNVTGFDIPKLMCGAFGTLGVLTELTFRLAPAPERAPALALRDCGAKDGLAALRKAAALPIEPTGLGYIPGGVPIPEADFSTGSGLALIRVEGSAPAVADKLGVLQRTFAAFDSVVLADGMTQSLFSAVSDGEFFHRTDQDVWRMALPSSEAQGFIAAAGTDLWYADVAGSVIWLALPATLETAARLRRLAAQHGGYATLMRANSDARAAVPVFEPESGARAALTRSVKAAFDPLGILNPGRMYPEI